MRERPTPAKAILERQTIRGADHISGRQAEVITAGPEEVCFLASNGFSDQDVQFARRSISATSPCRLSSTTICLSVRRAVSDLIVNVSSFFPEELISSNILYEANPSPLFTAPRISDNDGSAPFAKSRGS